MNEDIDIGAELYDKIHTDFLKQLGEARELRSMADVSGYSGRVGRALSRAIAANLSPDVLPDGRLYYNIARSILEPSLRENHELVNGAAEQVQRELDEREGIRIKPVRPEFPTERVNDVISAASAEGIPWEKTLRRVTSPAETVTMSFADDFMKANAEKRSRAGFDTFIDRQGGGKCCPWCAKLIGHFKYPDNVPKDVYRRHDNCTCTVTYGTKGGARQDVWSKVTWTVPPVKELHRGAVQGAEKAPHRLTRGVNAPALYDGSRFYRNVELGNEKSRVGRGSGGEILINASPVLNSNNRLFISDKLSPKPKLIHQVDNAMTEVLKDMGISDAENLPDVYIISDSEMAKNAVAAYRAGDNKFFVNADFAYYTRDKAPEIMQDFVCPEDYRSTYYHEMFHWLDAQEYREKVGEITKETYSDYDRYVQEKAKKALDKLDKSGYNIFEISEYASESLDKEKYDEAYTEYRTLLKLAR